jgi:hypothetical protein
MPATLTKRDLPLAVSRFIELVVQKWGLLKSYPMTFRWRTTAA